MEKTENKILEIRAIFEKVNCPVVVILKTPRAGDTVDNGYGVDFDLAPYAVIHENKMEDYGTLLNWEMDNDTDIMKFNKANCSNLEDMILELGETDGYEVIWREEVKK